MTFNTTAQFINTGLDQLGHVSYITACVKRHESTFPCKDRKSRLLINNGERD